MAEQPIAYVQIRDPDGKLSRAPVFADRVVIGRGTDTDIRLPRESISRIHAELVRDPFGRWLIRDLGSRAGVKIRGERVKQASLRFGQSFELGKYELKLWNLRPIGVTPKSDSAQTIDAMPDAETAATTVHSLKEIEPPKIDTMHLTTLSEFGQRLTEIEDPNERLRLLCRFVVRKDFHGLSAMALRMDKGTPTDPPQVLCEPQVAMGWERDATYVSRGLLRAVRSTRAPVIANNIAIAPAPGMVELSMSPETVGKMAAIACPLADEDGSMDVLYAVLPPEYGTAEWLAILALAATQYQQAESVWVARQDAQHNAAIEQDLASARKIQERLVPRNVVIEGIDWHVTYQPCEWVGGDYVDVVRMNDGRLFFAIADVSGHGLPAALISLSIHSIVHTFLRTSDDLSAMMVALNEHLCEFMEEGAFATMVGLMLDPRTGVLECINAGHPAVIVLQPDGTLRELQVAAHPPLGIEPTLKFTLQEDALKTGEIVAMYSDGLVEVPNTDGKLLGTRGFNKLLTDIVRKHANKSAEMVASTLVKKIEGLETNLLAEDDRSLLIARWVMA
ncbi:MAG: SpoIIE family protein phosphatase [Phycisphaeraceae bacterium]